jgi:AcrR family transcriptional regulator
VTQAVLTDRPRRTQAERRASTRGRLLDATIECLGDLGYAHTTTPEIARRAGLSRGAQLHHFPTKAELVIAAVEHLFARRHQEFRAAFARVPAGADRYAAAIDILWSMVSGPTFHAWLELAVASRTSSSHCSTGWRSSGSPAVTTPRRGR